MLESSGLVSQERYMDDWSPLYNYDAAEMVLNSTLRKEDTFYTHYRWLQPWLI